MPAAGPEENANKPADEATPCSMPRTPSANASLGPTDCAGGNSRTSSSSRSRTPDSRSHSFREASHHSSRGSAMQCNGTRSPLQVVASTEPDEDHAEKAPAASREASPAASVRRSSTGFDDTTTARTPNSNTSRTPDSHSHGSSRGSSCHSSRSSVTPRNATQSFSEAKALTGAATQLAEADTGAESAASKAASPVVSARRRSNGLRGTATLRSSMGLTAGSYADDFEEFAAEGDDSEGESEEEDKEDDDSEAASLERTN